MDYFIHLLLLIIAFVIGFIISIILRIKSYSLIALMIVIVYIPMELYHSYMMPIPTIKPLPSPNSHANSHANTHANTSTSTSITIPLATKPISDYHAKKLEAGNSHATEDELKASNWAIFKRQDELSASGSHDKNPFDGLNPRELLSRLNYIYYATANPLKYTNYNNFKTHADKYLDKDDTKLSTNDLKLQTYAAGNYPQLTADQIDAKDCLNYGSGPMSCFQSPQLFHNVKNNFNILDKGVNLDNANLVVREDFSMPMNLVPTMRYDSVLFANAPRGNLDVPIDQTSNEQLKLADTGMDTCHNCKMAVCKDDYCSLQNQLFI